MVHYLKDRGTYVLFNTNGTVLNPIGRQPAKRDDIVELGAGDGGEWSVMRCHVVPERGRRAVLCLKFGRPSVTERGSVARPLGAWRGGALRRCWTLRGGERSRRRRIARDIA
jgi:hypothetical protein